MWGQNGQRQGLYAVGTVLNNGRYRVNKRLNKGATAIVYAAEDLLTGRPVALKVVQCGQNKVPLNVVRREVSLSSAVAHENMVQLLDVFAEGTELIIVWELISGGDLLELLNECNGCMTETAAAFYYSQLLRGVLHMHAMGYCHRDIKPENCMIEASTQRLKLIDFGLSKHLESVATLGVGTPDYMPPEMVRAQMKQQQPQQQPGGPRPYDAKAVDAWAMGVLLYLLVTGCYPFEDPAHPNNITATLLNIRAGRCQPLPDRISPGCSAVIHGLLCSDPAQRIRLEDLAHNPWLLQSAAAHAAKLGPLGAHVDAGNPAWILPTVHHTAPAPPAAPMVPSRHSSNSNSSATTPLAAPAPPAMQLSHATSAAAHTGMQQYQQGQQHHFSAGQQQAWSPINAGPMASAAGVMGSPTNPQQQQQAWQHQQARLQQQQQQQAGLQQMPGAQTSGLCFSSAVSNSSTAAAQWQPAAPVGTAGAGDQHAPTLVTGHLLRQQLAVHSAPGMIRPLSPAGLAAVGDTSMTAAAGGGAAYGWSGGSGWQGGSSSSMAGGGYAHRAAGGVGLAHDAMEVDTAALEVPGGSVAVMVGQAGVDASRGFGTDQEHREDGGHDGMERRKGLGWLPDWVRKRA